MSEVAELPKSLVRMGLLHNAPRGKFQFTGGLLPGIPFDIEPERLEIMKADRRRTVVITPIGDGFSPDYLLHASESIEETSAALLSADLSAPGFPYLDTWVIATDGPNQEAALRCIDGIKLSRVEVVAVNMESDGQTLGPARRRNAALGLLADDDLVISLDADDTLEPVAAAGLIRIMNEHQVTQSGIEWIAANTRDIDQYGKHLSCGPKTHWDEGPLELDSMRQYAVEYGRFPFHCCATITSARILKSVGGWDESATFVRGEDVAMWARVSRDHVGYFYPDRVLNYRKHGDSLTDKYSWRTLTESIEMITGRLDDPDPSQGFVADLLNHAIPRQEPR